jgi:CRP/FNR family transcriptional regulator
MPVAARTSRAAERPVACRNCTLFQLCLPVGIGAADLDLLERIIKRRRMLERGEEVIRPGEPFRAVYAVRSGSIQTYARTRSGRTLVTGFHLPGELIGLDAIDSGVHHAGARALESSSVCELPFDRLEALGARISSVQRQMLRIMSKRILQDEVLRVQLCARGAAQRLAAFLAGLSQRFKRRGFSPTEFNLRMSRRDIGEYLGLAHETVSRLLARFERERLIAVRRRHVRILDGARLAALGLVPPPPP